MKSDSELLADVEAELDWDPSFDDRGVVIAVKDGVVTLAGAVHSYADKWSAENAAKSVAGVRAVANDIEVKLKADAQRTDREIAEAAVTALKSNVTVPAQDIKIIVNDGCVTLEGKVAMWYQRNAAETAVRNLWGVRAVRNHIEIKTKIYAGDIRGKIRQSFKRHADTDADKIQISVADRTVTLNGTVSTWREREDAESAAWAAPGVAHVKNLLSVHV
ncbi:MAG TPA: BON domain-containing protein [Steroidobacteraceae bacterium]|nr:BON domain-containing protein [Steroidobacteraceae bacterium]